MNKMHNLQKWLHLPHSTVWLCAFNSCIAQLLLSLLVFSILILNISLTFLYSKTASGRRFTNIFSLNYRFSSYYVFVILPCYCHEVSSESNTLHWLLGWDLVPHAMWRASFWQTAAVPDTDRRRVLFQSFVLPFSFAYVVVVHVSSAFHCSGLDTRASMVIVLWSGEEQHVWQQPGWNAGQRERAVDRSRPGRVGTRWKRWGRTGMLLGCLVLRPPALLLMRQRGVHSDVAVDDSHIGGWSSAAEERSRGTEKFLVSLSPCFVVLLAPY